MSWGGISEAKWLIGSHPKSMRSIDNLGIDSVSPLEKKLVVAAIRATPEHQIITAAVIEAHDLILFVLDTASHDIINLVRVLSIPAAVLLVDIVYVKHSN